jgi:hypothetical protein
MMQGDNMISQFDYEIIHESEEIEYGVIRGISPTVVFMKLPRGSNIYGNDNKFAKLAKSIRLYYGCHIICSSNYGDEISMENDLKIIKEYVSDKNIRSPIYKFIGFVEGANYGLSYLYHQIVFSKMVLVNMKMNNDLIKTIELLDGIDKNKVTFVYHPENSSYRYTLLLKRLYATVLDVKDAKDFSNWPKGKALFERLHLATIL